jgi:hypothetical protein
VILGLASAALALGLLVYALDRPPGSAYFLPADWSLAANHSRWFGRLGGYVPEFAHVYAFSLLTVIVLGAWRKLALPSCAAWWAIDSLFEIGQHAAISPHIAAAVPRWFDGIPFLENAAPYFLRGTFDPWDLVAIAFGALAAFATVLLLQWEGRRHAVS